MAKKLYFGSNLKMYKTIEETKVFLNRLIENTKDISREEIELFIIPSYLSLPSTSTIDKNLCKIGAQNMCWEEQGQFTGEISPLMLKENDIDLVMIGHSERRHVFKESDYEENLKVISALEHGFITLLCIGETGQEKEYGISPEVLRTQLKIGLHGIDEKYLSKLWVAYEPVWSIGVNGTPAKPEYAGQMHSEIRTCLVELFGEIGNDIPVLYGGSVNFENSSELIKQPNVDGLFIGRAAWDADNFNKIIKNIVEK